MRAASLLVLLSAAFAVHADRPTPVKSGIEFASADIRALQADEFANPGMLWVTRGEKLFQECSGCHAADRMKGVAARYPRIVDGKLMNLAGRINWCREQKQRLAPFPPESESLLGIGTYLAHGSRGMPVTFTPDPALEPYLDRGRALYHRRIGQLNLGCTHCHDRNWGKQLGAETVSQGHATAYPAYRLEWQAVGSIARRIRACFYGVRAQMPEYGAPELLELELYLAWRASGLPVEAPGVRR